MKKQKKQKMKREIKAIPKVTDPANASLENKIQTIEHGKEYYNNVEEHMENEK